MIRVLQIVNNMHRAGLETMLMNYYRRIDRDKIQFDFLTHRPERSDYDDEIESMGGKVYYAPRLYPQNLRSYYAYTKKFYSEHPEYKIVHSHIDAMSYVTLKAAKKSNVPIRIAHSHNTSIDKDFKYLLKQYYRSRINDVATDFLACGVDAGKFLFGKSDVQVIPNAIEKNAFEFDSNVRTQKREELKLSDCLVFGHIGRLSYQKNHGFLIDIFSEIYKQRKNAVLLIIGEGEKEAEIKKKVADMGLSDNVKFLGKRSDVNDLYQAMDAFIMPSRFEGVPVVGVEAQFSKLPCFFSDKVPPEVSFTSQTFFLPIESGPQSWADFILDKIDKTRSRDDMVFLNDIYDIEKSYISLENYYLEKSKALVC